MSETVEWGLHACLALSMLPAGARMPARFLAQYHGLKPAYLSKAMHKLAAAGIVLSVEGRSGGGFRSHDRPTRFRCSTLSMLWKVRADSSIAPRYGSKAPASLPSSTIRDRATLRVSCTKPIRRGERCWQARAWKI
ncbi:Rrf2 family transcriptional regulator [Agrobacterium tumefaciens]|nr:Rrf2 family transcriptional regulator [Agrobacterium tumefaciens]